MTDPSFDTGVGSWEAFPTNDPVTRVETSLSRSAPSCLLSQIRTAFWHGAGVALKPLTSPDETYTLTTYVRLAEADVADAGPPVTSAGLNLTLKTQCPGEGDQASGVYTDLGTTQVSIDTWTLITATIPKRRLCPEDETLEPIDYRVYIAQPISAEDGPWPSFYVDDVSFTRN